MEAMVLGSEKGGSTPKCSWERCELYLHHHAKGTLKWLALLRDGHMKRKMVAMSLAADGALVRENEHCQTLELTLSQPFDLNNATDAVWKTELWSLRRRFPILRVVGATAAKKLLKRLDTGAIVVYEGGAGFISSIGIHVEAYLKAELAGWDPPGIVTNAPRVAKRKACVVAVEGAANKSPKAVVLNPAMIAPPKDIQDARMVCGSRLLKDHLRKHPLGNFIANPHVKQTKLGASRATQTKADDFIKEVITKWALETREGVRFLANADLKPGEFTVDRIISRNGDGAGLNCIWNLYLMPFRTNCKFGDRDGLSKEAFVGSLAWAIAKEAAERFRNDSEKDYCWNGFEKRANSMFIA